MNSCILSFMLFLCPAVLGSFFISEIFANMPGRLSNKDSAWVELTNLYEQNITVSDVKLQIFDAASEPHFEHQLSLPGLPFDRHLVLAAKRVLIPGLCLDKASDFVLLPSFSIPKGRFKICVTLNHTLQDCAIFSTRDRFHDGVALYRGHEGLSVQTLWRGEPCHIKDGIFATPGLPERSCLKDEGFYDETLLRCNKEELPRYQSKSKLLTTQESKAPSIRLLEQSLVYIDDSDPSDQLVLASCMRPSGSERICHEAKKSYQITKAQTHPYEITPTLFDEDSHHFLYVRDLFGLGSSVETPKKRVAVPQLSAIKAKITHDHAQQFRLHFALAQEHVPLNYWLKNREGDVLSAGAFLHSGEKTLVISSKEKVAALSLVLKALHEEHTISLSDETPKGCSTKASIHWWILAPVALLRHLIKRFRCNN